MASCGDTWSQKKTVMPLVAWIRTKVNRMLLFIYNTISDYNIVIDGYSYVELKAQLKMNCASKGCYECVFWMSFYGCHIVACLISWSL